MCGIVGAIAERDVVKVLLTGLKRLEYRGYDSAGLAVMSEAGQIDRIRAKGKVAELESLYNKSDVRGQLGIAHTRWATHGEPAEHNAHPHFSNHTVALVHNGIIENYETLREQLKAEGYTFDSETDTEVIAHLIHHELKTTEDFFAALKKTIAQLEGAYGLGIIHAKDPTKLYAIRSGSPLVIGVGIGEHFIASDPLALLPVTQNFMYLEEGDFAVVQREQVNIFDKDGNEVEREEHESELSADQTSKGGYRHYMLKEIFEQPIVVSEAIEGRFANNKVVVESFGHNAAELFKNTDHVQIVACGTSYHGALVARYWLEQYAGVSCQVEVASENRYRDYAVPANSLFVAISQSGETADTLAALRKAKEQGYNTTLAICNVPESSLVREADLSFMTRAGAEIGVAATKSFTAQLIALLLMTLAIGAARDSLTLDQSDVLKALEHLPTHIQDALKLDTAIAAIASNFEQATSTLFLGRGVEYPIAMEGALKLKEISYIHAEAYAAGELKHGPLALVDQELPIVIIAPNDALTAKLASNLQEVRARGGVFYVFADQALGWKSEDEHYTVFDVPSVHEAIAPMLFNIPLQLLSYHVAVAKGTDVDQPRNLAKSVTVE